MEPATGGGGGGGGGIPTCLRHPSQILTGICSSCLAERLATVDSYADRSSNPTEIEPADERRPRRTLLSLFQSDDLERTCSTSSHIGDTTTQKPPLDRGGPFSLFSRRWRSRRSGSSNRSQTSEVAAAVDGGTSAETKHGSRHSCDWSFCRHPMRTSSSEAPRHSWDGGSVVGKAFACSFACLEEPPPQDGSCRVKMALPRGGNRVESRIPDREPCREEVPALPGINRKKSHRWSRVRDWSITSPFRDLVKKRDNALERSLSESWREGRKVKRQEGLEPDSNRIHSYANGHATSMTNQGMSRSINAASDGGHHNVRIDWQKKKESRFGRSRSVHYSSPGNLDNGLLRFYLTPLRSSRRSTAKGSRMRTSHSFARVWPQNRNTLFSFSISGRCLFYR